MVFRNGSKTEIYMTDYYSYNSEGIINTRVRKDSEDKLYWEFIYDHKIVDDIRETTMTQYESNGELMQE